MDESWLLCDRCRCGYSGAVTEPGGRCWDFSWVPDGWFDVERFGVRIGRAFMCKGRVWPEGHPQLTKRWSPERLGQERERLRQLLVSRVEARRARWKWAA